MNASLTRSVIDPAILIAKVSATSHGAVVLFTGLVRDTNKNREVRGLDYSAYEPMAEKILGEIVSEAALRFGTEGLAVEHRIGELRLGDVSVAIAAAHAHRGAAFEAARYIIEEIKKRVPIWKREHYADGTREWVDQSDQIRKQDVAE